MPVYEADVIHKILRDQRDYFLDCWAESILTRFDNKTDRNICLTKIKERHGEGFADDMRLRVIRVWESNKK